jgi:uncharacterized protein (DUF488 family)
MQFFTIGAYNSDAEVFFEKLTLNSIDTFSDIRQRRGVRGARYSFANSNRLQKELQELGIRYHHTAGLAPTPEIRLVQDKTDKQQKKKKKDRTQLSEAFILAYQSEVLSKFDFEGYLQELEEWKAHKIALFCVEAQPESCHRSLAAKKLNELGYKITHL